MFPTSRSPLLPFVHPHHILRNTLSRGHCHHISARCLCLLPLPVTCHDFLPWSILIQLSLLPSDYYHLLLGTMADLIMILRRHYNRVSQGKVITYYFHLFFRCSFKVVLRQWILFSNNCRNISEASILTSCKNVMIPSFPFSPFY